MIRRYHETEIEELANLLMEDGVIAVPTDTVFGVCAKMASQNAQERLRIVKNRPKDKAFPIMCANLEQIEALCVVNEKTRKMIRAFMPGPITLVLQKKEEVPSFVNGGLETIAIRMATSETLEALIQKTGPLYMTSANQSGQPVATTIEEIEESCPLLDGILIGKPSFGQASTIVACGEELKVLREGPITLEELKKVWEDIK